MISFEAYSDEMQKISGEARIPKGGLRTGLWMNDTTQVMSKADAKRVKEKLPWYRRSGPGVIPAVGLGAIFGMSIPNLAAAIRNRSASGRSRLVGAGLGALLVPLAAHRATRVGKYEEATLDAARKMIREAG
jgi:hypothetical protein